MYNIHIDVIHVLYMFYTRCIHVCVNMYVIYTRCTHVCVNMYVVHATYTCVIHTCITYILTSVHIYQIRVDVSIYLLQYNAYFKAYIFKHPLIRRACFVSTHLIQHNTSDIQQCINLYLYIQCSCININI